MKIPSSGGLPWNVADCRPEHSDSVIDYLGHKKLVLEKLGPLFRKLKVRRKRR